MHRLQLRNFICEKSEVLHKLFKKPTFHHPLLQLLQSNGNERKPNQTSKKIVEVGSIFPKESSKSRQEPRCKGIVWSTEDLGIIICNL